jgi:hypothetical protein
MSWCGSTLDGTSYFTRTQRPSGGWTTTAAWMRMLLGILIEVPSSRRRSEYMIPSLTTSPVKPGMRKSWE